MAQKLAAAGANALVGFTAPQDLAASMQAVRAAHLSFATSVSLTGYDRTILPTLGQSLAGVSFTVYFRPFEAGGPAVSGQVGKASGCPENHEEWFAATARGMISTLAGAANIAAISAWYFAAI